MAHELKNHLDQLERLIIQERCFAQKLQVKELKELQEEKGALIKIMSSGTEVCPSALKPQIARICADNIRNARLLHTCLANLRQMVRHCSERLTPVIYSQKGVRVQALNSGMLLNGSI